MRNAVGPVFTGDSDRSPSGEVSGQPVGPLNVRQVDRGSPSTKPALSAVWHVYLLRDPRDNAPRYVGVTEMAPKDRAHRHVSQALQASRRKSQGPKDAWIIELLGAQLRPVVDVVERVETTRADAGVRERAWIVRLTAERAALLNGGGKTKRGAWGGVVGRLRETLAGAGIVVAEKHTLTTLRRLEAKGAAKSLRGSTVFLRPDVHEAVERALAASARP